MDYITVTMDIDDLLDLLKDRLKYWTNDDDIVELYLTYYEDMAYGGVFDNIELDIKNIVDNDYINYTRVLEKDDLVEEYGKDWKDEAEILAEYECYNAEKDIAYMIYLIASC